MQKCHRENPVLIAGAGPVGLSLALALARRGIPVEVFEKETELADEERASTIHPPTLEYLQEWGVLDPVLAAGAKVDRLQYRERDPDRIIASFDYSLIAGDTPFPFRFQLPQNHLTRILRPALLETGLARIHMGCAVLGHEDHGPEQGVTLQVSGAAGRKSHRGCCLVGCDGSASPTREQLGMVLEGETLEDRFLLIPTDGDLRAVMPDLAPTAYIFDPQEWIIVMHLKGFTRVVFRVAPLVDMERATDDEEVRRRMDRLFGEVPYRILGKSVYRVHQRVAPRFFRGNVILAGDAAHINNPAGGMGMNSGIHDAAHLADSLGRILLEGEDQEKHLGAYEGARRGFALENVQKNTVRNYRELSLQGEAERRARNADLARTAADPAAARAFLLRAAMIPDRE